MRDFNISMDNKFVIDFCKLNDLSSLNDKSMCYKNFHKPTCIELILTNKLRYLKSSNF